MAAPYPKQSPKPLCKYGSKCYRKNPDHLRQYRHHNLSDISEEHAHTASAETDIPLSKRPKIVPEPNKNAKSKISDFFITNKPKCNEATNPIVKPKDQSKDEEQYIFAKDSISVEKSDFEHLEPQDEKTNLSKDIKNVKKDLDMGDLERTDKATKKICGETNEDNDLPVLESPIDIKQNIKQKYKLEMPTDFYTLWEFCSNLCPLSPKDALKNTLGLTLTGPYDIMAGLHKHASKSHPDYNLHQRYYYDPPEFMTVIKGDDSTQFHIGYYRDDPDEMPAFVASNKATVDCTLNIQGHNLFAAIYICIKEKLKEKDHLGDLVSRLKDLETSVVSEANLHGFCLDARCKHFHARKKRVVCTIMNGVGIVVPVTEDDVGYRPVPASSGEIKKMCTRITNSKTADERNQNFEPLQEIITLIQFANDECDYGEGLELGLQLFCFGSDTLHRVIGHLLPMAYQLLNRPLFAEIIKDHLKHRNTDSYKNQLD